MRFDVSENLVRLAFLGLIVGFVFLIINGVASLAVPFAISFLLAFMLQPMVNGIEGLGLPRIIAALLSLLPVVGLFFFVTYTIIPIAAEQVQLFTHSEKIEVDANNRPLLEMLQAVEGANDQPAEESLPHSTDTVGNLEKVQTPEDTPAPTENVTDHSGPDQTAVVTVESTAGIELGDKVEVVALEYRIAQMVYRLYQNSEGQLPTGIHSRLHPTAVLISLRTLLQSLLPGDFSFVGDIVTNILVTPIILIIFLMQGDSILKRILTMVPNRFFEMTLSLLHTIQHNIIAYLKGLSYQWLIFGSVLSVALWMADLPSPILMAFVAATFNVIPYVGPALGAVPAIALALLVPEASVVSVLIAFGITQLVDNMFTQPIILAGSVSLHPLIAILTLITLQQYLGIVGMIIAIPLASIVLVSIEIMYRQMKAYGII